MTVILIEKGAIEPNSKYGYVIEMFDTVEDFKAYIRGELFDIRRNLRADGMEDEELDNLIAKELTNWSFSVLWDKYLEYNSDDTFEVI